MLKAGISAILRTLFAFNEMREKLVSMLGVIHTQKTHNTPKFSY